MIYVSELKCEYKVNPIGIDTAKPRFSYVIGADHSDVMQSAYQIVVRNGNEVFWDSGRVESEQSIQIPYGGPVPAPKTRYTYQIKIWSTDGEESDFSEPQFFETGIGRFADSPAKWISARKDNACLHKTFTLTAVKDARIYASACGLYRIILNGKDITEDLLTPGWTAYKKRIQYQTYDVTPFLKTGENTIDIYLGNGWYKGRIGWADQTSFYGYDTAAIMELDLEGVPVLVTDESWKWSRGNIEFSEFYDGEVYDARLDYKKALYPVQVMDVDKNLLVAQENDPVRRIEEIKPLSLITTPKGETVLDMGQNMVGHLRFKVKGNPGDVVIIRHAEVLDKDGNFYLGNLRTAKEQIVYILKGGEEEIFEPHFTFMGFRYIRIDRYPGEVKPENFTGIVMHTDMEETGDFSCSNPMVNQLVHNIKWGQKGNFVDVPTDCPQRDERLGWSGDAQVFCATASYNMNTASFFTKWLHDVAADQMEDGRIPDVIPDVLIQGGACGWGDCAVICPQVIYNFYADTQLLAEQYDSMKKWVEYIRGTGDDEYLWNTGKHFGDWLALDSEEDSYRGATDHGYVATVFYANSVDLLSKAAKILGKNSDADAYRALHSAVKDRFCEVYIGKDGLPTQKTQTAYVLALHFHMVPEELRTGIAKALADDILAHDTHLTTGFLGTPYLCFALCDNGYEDLAFALLMKDDYPSWLYEVKMGATTIWEHWDGIKPDGSFWSDSMNSYNHYAYGAIGEWLYRYVGGIGVDETAPGFKHILLAPHIGADFTYVNCSYKSMYGNIVVNRNEDGDTQRFYVEVPCNTTASFTVPAGLRQAGEVLHLTSGKHELCFDKAI